MRRFALANVLFAGFVLPGCGGDRGEVASRETAAVRPDALLKVSKAEAKFYEGGTVSVLRGTADPGATIEVDGKTTEANPDGTWAIRAEYKSDRSELSVTASADGKNPKEERTPQPTRPELALSARSRVTTFTDSIELKGRVTVSRGSIRGARVTVNGQAATVDGTRWSKVVTVRSGTRRFELRAAKRGADGGDASVVVTRRLSAAEKAERKRLAEERRKAAAARRAERRREAAARRAGARALASAKAYLSSGSFSKMGLYQQLSSSAGEGYTESEAQYAVDHVGSPWKKEAVEAAKSYLDYSSFSRSGLIDQLSSAAGEGFTYEEAVYAVDKVY